MADNVNITVQDTINEIVVNAAVIVETIDINVQVAVDEVQIIANPNNYVINVNRIIGEQVQSDWTQNDDDAPDYIKNKPILATVATSGDYTDLLNTPTIPTLTSDLTNDGSDGVNPFITAADIPPVTGFVPYTGADQDVDLGEFGLLTGNVEFDNTPTNIPTAAGSMYYNDADGTVDLILKGGNVKLQIGQESVIRVVNKTATNINLLEANYQAVRVTGAQGQRLKVDLAQATTDNLSAETIGLVTETINNNQEGFVTTSGLVRSINTTGSLQGETWADGDILYLSPTTAGNVTKVKPVAPNHLVIVGYVVHAHVNQGSIFVKVDNGYELDELHNVKIVTPLNNQGLVYNSTTDIWENKTIIEDAIVNGVTTIAPSQNAVFDALAAKFTLPALTSGSVLFSNGTTIAQDNAQLFWDDTNNRLGIGTATPTTALDVNGTVKALALQTTDLIANSPTQIILVKNSSGTISARLFSDGSIFRLSSSGQTATINIFANGNLGVNQTTDGGFRLDVNGTARVQGNLTLTGTNLTLQNSATVDIKVRATSTTSYAAFNFYNSSDAIIGGLGYGNSGVDATYANKFYLSNANSVPLSFIMNFIESARFFNNGNLTLQNGGTYTDISSSKLTINSTTQGFLPPRMTTTQKNAIATPAAGLVVYDTTLNKLCLRTAAAWEVITSL